MDRPPLAATEPSTAHLALQARKEEEEAALSPNCALSSIRDNGASKSGCDQPTRAIGGRIPGALGSQVPQCCSTKAQHASISEGKNLACKLKAWQRG